MLTSSRHARASLRLFGLQLEGDVDDNDKLYIGVRCVPPDPVTSSGDGACPPGQLVAGIEADGSLICEGPAPAIAGYVAEHCSVTLGLRDECDGCTTAPAKSATGGALPGRGGSGPGERCERSGGRGASSGAQVRAVRRPD